MCRKLSFVFLLIFPSVFILVRLGYVRVEESPARLENRPREVGASLLGLEIEENTRENT